MVLRYTFAEINRLMLSTFPQQRTIGLRVFGAILERWEGQADGLQLSLRIKIPESSVEALINSLHYISGGLVKV